MKYQLMIIGAGPGGYAAAIKAAQMGKKVAIVEKDAPGGTCLNHGCIPTKALTASRDLLRKVKSAAKLGVNIEKYTLDFPKVQAHKARTISQITKGIEFMLKKHQIDYYSGSARILDPTTIEVTGQKTFRLTGDNLLIATGSQAITIPALNYDGRRIVTSEEILELTEIPESLLVVGGGVIGCELAGVFNEMGSKVTVVDIMPRLIPNEDEELSQELRKHFKRAQIKVQLDTKIETIEKTAKGIIAKLTDGSVIEAALALLSLGRAPYYSGLGLSEIGVEVARGIVVDDYLQTNIPNVYAIGDVTDQVLLAHVASAQGLQVVDNIFGQRKPMSYEVIPNCIFTYPEIASVGLTKETAQEKDLQPKTAKVFFRSNGKALTLNESDGFVKVIADRDDRLIGAQIIGPHASDLIHELALAIKNQLTVKDITSTIHAHPTLSESLLEAAQAIYS